VPTPEKPLEIPVRTQSATRSINEFTFQSKATRSSGGAKSKNTPVPVGNWRLGTAPAAYRSDWVSSPTSYRSDWLSSTNDYRSDWTSSPTSHQLGRVRSPTVYPVEPVPNDVLVPIGPLSSGVPVPVGPIPSDAPVPVGPVPSDVPVPTGDRRLSTSPTMYKSSTLALATTDICSMTIKHHSTHSQSDWHDALLAESKIDLSDINNTDTTKEKLLDPEKSSNGWCR
jgi:hypothetical protein